MMNELRLLAPGFYRRNSHQIRRQVVRLKRFDVEFDETERWHAQIHRAIRAVHYHRHASYLSTIRTNDVDGLLYPATLGHDVFDHQKFFTGNNVKSAAQHEFALFFFDKN